MSLVSICESGRAASAVRSLFWILVSFFFVEPPFSGSRLSYCTLRPSDHLPALLSFDDPVRERDGAGVLKYQFGGFESDVVLPPIRRILSVVPGETGGHTNTL